jgi:hypothetical protein
MEELFPRNVFHAIIHALHAILKLDATLVVGISNTEVQTVNVYQDTIITSMNVYHVLPHVLLVQISTLVPLITVIQECINQTVYVSSAHILVIPVGEEVLEPVTLVVMMLLKEIQLKIVDVKTLIMNTFHIMNVDHVLNHAQPIVTHKPNVTRGSSIVKTISLVCICQVTDQSGNVCHASTHASVVTISTQLTVEFVDLEPLTELPHTTTDGGITTTGAHVNQDSMKLPKFVYHAFFLV